MLKQKIKFLYIFFFSYFTIYTYASSKVDMQQSSIVLGESLNYTAHWGLLNIGSASTNIDKKMHKIGNNLCSKIEVRGQTNGIAKLFNVQDKWISYIDTSTIKTYKSMRFIKEGSYELKEIADFDHQNRKATVKVSDSKTNSYQLKKTYDTPDNIRDIVAGFVYLRTLDFQSFNIGDKVSINGFYEDEGYKIDILYAGKENLKIDNSIINCHKLRPIIPKNNFFEGNNPVTVWLSNNSSQKVVKLQAKLLVGSIIIELKNP